jgi:hypothetical protein
MQMQLGNKIQPKNAFAYMVFLNFETTLWHNL